MQQSNKYRQIKIIKINYIFKKFFFFIFIVANTDQKAKLTKLLSLWESKANFFDACVISKLRSPASSMQEYKTNLMNTYNNVVAQISQTTKATFEKYYFLSFFNENFTVFFSYL